ncbi:hypothetical protein EJB05_55799, partial [Eragrostis curvula]
MKHRAACDPCEKRNLQRDRTHPQEHLECDAHRSELVSLSSQETALSTVTPCQKLQQLSVALRCHSHLSIIYRCSFGGLPGHAVTDYGFQFYRDCNIYMAQ